MIRHRPADWMMRHLVGEATPELGASARRCGAVRLNCQPQIFGVPRALPVRDIPARSPSVVMVGQARSHGSGSYRVDAHDPVAGGRDSPAVAVLPIRGGGEPWRA